MEKSHERTVMSSISKYVMTKTKSAKANSEM